MKKLISILLTFSLLTPNLSPFSTLLIHFSNKSSNTDIDVEIDENEEETQLGLDDKPEKQVTPTNENNYNIKDNLELDIEGYCTIKIPQSHLKVVGAESTDTQKTLIYKDNISRLTMSYITNIASDIDIPGYITNEVAKVTTTTNNKTNELYGNNITWVKIPSDNKEDGNNVYVWYTVHKSAGSKKQSVFWVKAKVNPDSDNDEFKEVLKNVLDTYKVYAASQGTVFQTPDSGYYKENDVQDNKADNTSSYKANSGENTVFQKETGIIENKNISKSWKDLEMIVDGAKVSVPCSVNKLYEAGFKVHDILFKEDETLEEGEENYNIKLEPQCMIDINFVNSDGTVIVATFMNESATDIKNILDCNVFAIAVDYNSTMNQADSKNHELVLPGGVTWSTYRDALVNLYGSNYTVEDSYDDSDLLVWKSQEKGMKIKIGKIKTISYAKITCLIGKDG